MTSKKSIGTYFAQYFKMPHLHRDDLEAIEQMILRELKPGAYSLAFEGAEYSRLEHVPDDAGTTHVFIVYTSEPSMRLKLSRSWAELYSGENTREMDVTIRKIAQIVARTDRRWLWEFCQSSAWLAPLIGFGSFGLVMSWVVMGFLPMRSLYGMSLLLILMSVWWGMGYHYKLHCFSRVDLQGRRPNVSWLERHARVMVLYLSIFVLGAVCALLFSEFLRSS